MKFTGYICVAGLLAFAVSVAFGLDCSQCGKANPKAATRIVNGEETDQNEFPWQALINYKGHFRCGGVLINDKYILTAGHCLKSNENLADYEVILGEHTRDKNEGTEAKHSISEYNDLGPWDANDIFSKDIAVVKLSSDVTFTEHVRPICIPKEDSSFVDWNAIISGWGQLGYLEGNSNTLQHLSVKVLANSACNEKYGATLFHDYHWCIDSDEGNSCFGDSGGPAVVKYPGKEEYYLIGLLAFTSTYCSTYMEMGYTRVGGFLGQIKEIVGSDKVCHGN